MIETNFENVQWSLHIPSVRHDTRDIEYEGNRKIHVLFYFRGLLGY